jgi:hypothetical protein
MLCHHCGGALELDGKVSRTESCRHCDYDMHVCLNCKHYDPFAPNQCRETQVELVRDKEKANFCDYFTPNQKKGSSTSIGKTKADEARNAFDNLFKK